MSDSSIYILYSGQPVQNIRTYFPNGKLTLSYRPICFKRAIKKNVEIIIHFITKTRKKYLPSNI